MKKLIFLLIAVISSASAIAQTTNEYPARRSPRWAIDMNLRAGGASQKFKTANSLGNYPEAINSNTGDLKYTKGFSYGADLQLGYFFGKGRNFGLGTGLMYMEQKGDITLTNFRIDSRATDGAGNVFRQVIKGNDVRENITSRMVNVPVMFKYKGRMSKRWGVSADVGALINLRMMNSYTTNATFDQESIYKFQQNPDGSTTSVYDNSPTPSADSWIISRDAFMRNNPNGDWDAYASTKREMGINVGDGMTTNNRTGKTEYNAGSIGLMIQPTVNYYLSDNVSINLGGYYMMQPFKNNAQSDYRLTDGNGSYSSVQNNVTSSQNSAYGVNAGVRFFLGRKDRDKDGVADKKDDCPDVQGLADFNGCPDTDKDGIPDNKDSCVNVFGQAQFNGCPDTDGDDIMDKEDECPFVAGTKALKGCPDRDKDGIADKDDLCPDVFGLAIYRGCPDTDGDGVPDNKDKCPTVPGPVSNDGCPEPKAVTPAPKEEVKTTTTQQEVRKGDMTTPITFEVNKAHVNESFNSTIEDAVYELNKNKEASIVIDGHADSSGPEDVNKILARRRAESVKAKLIAKGVNPNRLKVVGHGSDDPAASNDTYEGKKENRRVKMKLKE